jgi:hypothetical protein
MDAGKEAALHPFPGFKMVSSLVVFVVNGQSIVADRLHLYYAHNLVGLDTADLSVFLNIFEFEHP